MTEQIINEWLADYAALSLDEIHSYATTINHNADVINAIIAVLEDRQKYDDLVDKVCSTLFALYRSKEVELKRFTLAFLPTLIFVYLNAVAHGEKKSCLAIEALLVGLYNSEAIDENGAAQQISFRLPSLAQASIYHEPMSLAPASLTENALRRLEECNTKLVKWGPLPPLEKIIPQNRLSVMTALLFIYNLHISCLQKNSLDQLCKVVSKLVTQGFNKPNKRVSYSSEVSRVLPRIPVASKFFLEILHSLYFSIFNGDSIMALQAVDDVHQRACFQGYTEVLLMTNAIRNNRSSYSGQITDNPMGISLAISPVVTSTVVSKSMITNASFRTKKLPDDIPIQFNRGEGDTSGLGSISEEKEDGAPAESGGGTTARRSLPKMAANFGKKTRERLSSKGKLRTVNGGDSWDQEQSEAEPEPSLIVGDPDTPGKTPNNGSTLHEVDSRTMQVSSV